MFRVKVYCLKFVFYADFHIGHEDLKITKLITD